MSKLAKVFGVILVIVGILGFIPNPVVGSGAFLETDFLHNLVHLVLGVALLVWPNTMGVRIVGAVFLVVAILGFLGGTGRVLSFLTVNSADNWLHLVLGAVLLAVGLLGKKETGMPPAQPAQPV